jgi:catechol 2,3-dioxygenase-like lactoylglutathione lyase family enzyme
MQHEFVGVITVFVENVERARKFYTEVVGLEAVEEVSTPGEVVLRSFRGPLIILQFDAEVSRRPVQPFGTELGLVVPDLEVAWARWQNADATVLTEPLPAGAHLQRQESIRPPVTVLRADRYVRSQEDWGIRPCADRAAPGRQRGE